MLDGKRGDGGKIIGAKLLLDEIARGLANSTDPRRARKGKVEEQQEAAPRGRVDRLLCESRRPRRLGVFELRHVDGLNRHGLPVVSKLEVRDAQPVDRFASPVEDAHRNLDERNARGFLDGSRLRGKQRTAGKQNQE